MKSNCVRSRLKIICFIHFVKISVIQDLPVNFAVEASFMINFVLIKTFDKDLCLCDSYKMLISHFNITGGRTSF